MGDSQVVREEEHIVPECFQTPDGLKSAGVRAVTEDSGERRERRGRRGRE